MCCMTSDFANIGHTTFTLVSELHRFLFPRELKQSQKSRSVIRGLKAGNSVLIITPGVPCVIAALVVPMVLVLLYYQNMSCV